MTINAKVIESMRLFAESYTKSTDTYCVDLDVTESVIQGLSKNKQLFGAPCALVVITIIKKMKLV
jgi:ferredoxin-thioredoxin reductase catalytic subunit